MKQASWWILTIPENAFSPSNFANEKVDYITGQLEVGEHTSFRHWQLVVHFVRKVRLGGVRNVFGPFHAEPTRSEAAVDYVHKDETAVANTRFELGRKPMDRGKSHDWDGIRNSAVAGRMDNVPSDVYIRYFRNLLAIHAENSRPSPRNVRATVYWGPTGVGKTRRAHYEFREEDIYVKDPRSKWWCGYRGEKCVIIDEFRGGIDISHVLRWIDRYPCRVEHKGSSGALLAERFIFTSNVPPNEWYPGLDGGTLEALYRRLEVIHMDEEWLPPVEVLDIPGHSNAMFEADFENLFEGLLKD